MLPLKILPWKPSWSSGGFLLHELPVLLAWPCNKSFSAPNASGLVCLASCTLVCLDSCPLSWWRYLIISSFATPFSFCLQSFPDAGSFPMSQPFASGGQSTGASVAVLPMHIQGWFPLGLTGLFSLQSKGLLRVFSIGSCLVSVPQNVIVFGPRLYKEIIKLQWGH